MKTKLNRIYVRYELWEEIAYNMWGYSKDKKGDLIKAIDFTSDYILYGSFMKKVINTFHYSCINALTDYSINRRAWLGHAAVALAMKIPEYITREAWKTLSDEQRFLANKQAERYINEWEFNYRKNNGLYTNMEVALL